MTRVTRSGILLALGGAAVGLALAVGALEVALRVFPQKSQGQEWYLGGNHARGLVSADPELGYALTPGFSSRDVNVFGDFDVPTAVNDLGLRDDERDPAGCASLIIGLGDSYTYGEGVPLEKTYLARVEALLRQGGDRDSCVLKAGVPGYGLDQMSLLYRRLGERYPHQVVLVGLLEDDLLRVNQGFAEYDGWLVHEAWKPVLQSCPDGFPHVRKARLNSLHHGLVCSSRAYRWLVARRLPGKEGRTLGAALLPELAPVPAPQASRDEPARLFLEMKAAADEYGAALLVLGFCFDDPRMAAFLRGNGIGYVSIACDEAWRFEHDWHFNEQGHAAVADIVFDLLTANEADGGDARNHLRGM